MTSASTANSARTPPTTTELLVAFGCFHFMFLPVVILVIVVGFGLWYAPTLVFMGVVVPYYSWIWSQGLHRKSGTPLSTPHRQHFLEWIFAPLRKHLNLTLHADPQLLAMEQKEPSNNNINESPQYILAVFPHGVQADFRVLADGLLHQVLPQTHGKVRTLAASVLFAIPYVREMVLATGGVDANRKTAQHCLQQGLTLQILVGGQQEQLRTQPGQEKVYLRRNRLGFCKLALRHGVPLVPVYVFGNNDHYQTQPWLLPLQLWVLQTLGISLTFASGLWGSPACPQPIATTLVFGPPLVVPQVDDPTPKQVEKVHEEFVQALIRLFDQHKERLGYGDRTLEII